MLEENSCKEMIAVSLPNNKVQCRFGEMAKNSKVLLITRIHDSHLYALQLHESMDIAIQCDNPAFVSCDCSGNVDENFLFCRSPHTHATSYAIFGTLVGFI
jgi:hypothetical protein